MFSTLALHVWLMVARMHLLEMVRKATDDLRREWEAFRVEQEKWHELIKQEQKSPWDIHRKQRSA